LGAVVACGAAADGAGAETDRTIPGVGDLPGAVSSTIEAESTVVTSLRVTTTLPADEQVGYVAAGNRVIVIGDSVVASTARRYTGDMCEVLVPLGWQVEVDAETSRFIEFGNSVLDRRLAAGWDVGVIMLGNNYAGDEARYRQQLERMVRRLSPNPVVLLTVSEFIPSRRAVNDVIREMAEIYDNVMIVDWAATTLADGSLVGGDGLHLTTAGRAALAADVSLALGPAPKRPGKCLPTEFDDDSGGSVEPTQTTVRPSGTAVPGTTKPRATTTVPDTAPPESTEPPATDPPGT
jgi:hypothetical protein